MHDLRLRAAVDRLGEESLSQIAADLGYRSDEGGPAAGKIELYSGATGAKLRTITSTTAGENLGFDAVGVGDVNRDHRPDLLGSAAEGDTVYMIAGDRRR